MAVYYKQIKLLGNPYLETDKAELAVDGDTSTCAKSALDYYSGRQRIKLELENPAVVDTFIIHIHKNDTGKK